jgi:hypothetical protein
LCAEEKIERFFCSCKSPIVGGFLVRCRRLRKRTRPTNTNRLQRRALCRRQITKPKTRFCLEEQRINNSRHPYREVWRPITCKAPAYQFPPCPRPWKNRNMIHVPHLFPRRAIPRSMHNKEESRHKHDPRHQHSCQGLRIIFGPPPATQHQ